MNGSVNVPGVSGADLARIEKKVDSAVTSASAASTAATAAQTAAEQAQKSADAALKAVEGFAFTISTIPSQNGTLTYNGSEQSPTWNSFNPDALELGGVTKGTDAGSYIATFTPKEGYKWSDETTDAKEVTWTINRATIATPPSQSNTLTYTGAAQSPTWDNYDTAQLTIGGEQSATDAGNHVATFTPTKNYQWSDNTTNAKQITWSIGRATIAAVPAQSGTLTYTGSAQSPSWSNYDAAKMTLGGATSGTNAGSYAATFTPNANYQWSGGETTAKTVNWSIGKAAGSLSLNKSSLTLNNTTKTSTITVTRAGDGAITATSGDTGIATVSVSGTTITVTAVAYGSATITVNVAEGTNHTAPSSKTCSVTVNLFNDTLNSNTWAAIKAASDADDGANVWSVGDTKAVTINGTVQGFTFSNLTVQAFITGFNHNSGREGNHKIHFQLGKISNKLVALCDNNYGSTGSGAGFRMNQSNTNAGGWKDSYMRKTVLGNSGTPTSPPANSLLAALPSDLRAVMKPITKYTDNVGNNTGNVESNVTATTDYLVLYAEFEVFGSRSGANSYEQNYQVQYPYYQAGNSKVAYKHNALDTAVWWWLRSPNYGGNGSFRVVNSDGNDRTTTTAYTSGGVAPGFAA